MLQKFQTQDSLQTETSIVERSGSDQLSEWTNKVINIYPPINLFIFII